MNVRDRIARAEQRLEACSQLQLAAHHEAGHAVIGWMMGESPCARGLAVDKWGNGHAHVRGGIALPRSRAPRGASGCPMRRPS